MKEFRIEELNTNEKISNPIDWWLKVKMLVSSYQDYLKGTSSVQRRLNPSGYAKSIWGMRVVQKEVGNLVEGDPKMIISRLLKYLDFKIMVILNIFLQLVSVINTQ